MKEQLYRTPEGMVDIPFLYVFDGRGLVNGTSPQNLITRIQQNDFILRSAVGLVTVAGQWRYYNPSESDAIGFGIGQMGNPVPLAQTSNRWTVVPEKLYPATSQIKFDLGNVAIALNEDDQEIGFIGFQGVKRVGKGQFGWTDYQTQYKYYERPTSYELEVLLNFFVDTGSAPMEFEVQITNADFELQKICIHPLDARGGGPPPPGEDDGPSPASLGPDPFLIRLYDPSGYDALSTEPHPARWLNFYENTGNFFSIFPVPTLVYPVLSRIKVEITSLLLAAGGNQTFQISFQGVERQPC